MRFQVSPMFSDNMVLQRGKNICVFGTGEDGVKITAELCGFTTSCTVADGKWKLVFPPMGACRFMNLTLTDDETGEDIYFENVAIGEVWLACGGSGMENELQNCIGGEEALKDDKSEDVRYYAMPRSTKYDDDYESAVQSAHWSDFSDRESARGWSAVGYYCAKVMSEYLDVVVGIVECSWGDTPSSSWLEPKYVRGGAEVYFEEYNDALEGKTVEQAVAEFHEFQKNGGIGHAPHAPCNPCSPGVIYENMISQIIPYTLGGVLWYQGESDIRHPHAHYTIISQIIRNWREEWQDEELPFIIGQLPMFSDNAPDNESMCLIREAQMRIYRSFKNTGICVLLDCGKRDDLQPIGRRFAMQALNIIRGGCDGAFAPTIKSAVWRGETVELQFNDSRGGFKVLNPEPEGFEVCGTDGVYYPAFADVAGERIFLSSEHVEQPVAARYLWKSCAEIHLVSAFGLPLSPFRIKM